METEDPERARVLELLRTYGWNATSFQCLEPGFRYWFGPGACVVYVDTGRAWVAAGRPIAAAERCGEVARHFAAAARSAGRRVSFFGVESQFLAMVQYTAMHIGEQPVWNPQAWAAGVESSRNLREQLRRARAKGLVIRAVSPEQATAAGTPLRRAVDALVVGWMASRPLPPMGFLVQVFLFAFPSERRYFAAVWSAAESAEPSEGSKRAERVAGFLSLVPVYARGGWLFEDLLRGPDSPNGTVELLIDYAMREIAAEGCRYATLGLAPLAGGASALLRAARRWGPRLYDFEGLRSFKAKLRPGEWEPTYLAFPPDQSELSALYDVLAAFTQGGLLRFGIDSLLHAPALAVRTLTVLLLPWTLLLAAADPQRWFPVPWVQTAWVAFDLFLIVALSTLSVRWRPWLATLLAACVTADAALTTLEAFAYNLPRARGPLDWLVVAVSILGPSAASLLLWGARAHRSRVEEPNPTAR